MKTYFVYILTNKSNRVLYTGVTNNIQRRVFEHKEKLNKGFRESKTGYVLVGPGRWGSSDPWLGIPVKWSQISAARIIVESGLENFRIDPSQGTHFFHNIIDAARP